MKQNNYLEVYCVFVQACHDLMNKCIVNMNQRADKQYFLELNNTAFNLPKKFEFQAHKGDEVSLGSIYLLLTFLVVKCVKSDNYT